VISGRFGSRFDIINRPVGVIKLFIMIDGDDDEVSLDGPDMELISHACRLIVYSRNILDGVSGVYDCPTLGRVYLTYALHPLEDRMAYLGR